MAGRTRKVRGRRMRAGTSVEPGSRVPGSRRLPCRIGPPMTTHRRIVAALALLIAAPGFAADPGTPLMGPYTNRVDAESGSVSWVTAAGVAPGTLRFTAGPRTGIVKAVVRPFDGRTELLHTAKLAGLPADTPVSWEVRSGQTSIKGGFRTALPKGSRTPFRFIVYGDTRSYPDRHASVVGGMAKE